MKKQTVKTVSIKSADCAVEVEIEIISQQNSVEILINKVKNVLPIGKHISEGEKFYLVLTCVFNKCFKHLVVDFIHLAMGKTIEEIKLLVQEKFALQIKVA